MSEASGPLRVFKLGLEEIKINWMLTLNDIFTELTFEILIVFEALSSIFT